MSFEWFDRLEGFVIPSSFPVLNQLDEVGRAPFLNVRHRPTREATRKHYSILYCNGCFIATVSSMEVGRVVIAVEHSDHDS